MNEQKQEALAFARSVQAGFLATVEKGENGFDQPRVRGVLMWYVDESGFYFHTAKSKDLYQQLTLNPRVEIAFVSQQPVARMLRVWGDVDFIEDRYEKERLLAERPWLLQYGEEGDNQMLSIFRIVNSEGKFWQKETNMQEKTATLISF